MEDLRIVDETVLTERQKALAKLEEDLVVVLNLLDDIRLDRRRANDAIGATFMGGVTDSLIAFANLYFRRAS